MTSPWSDLDRPPLSQSRLRRVLGGQWRDLVVVAETRSTNADVADALRAGDGDRGDGLVIVAERQTAGRGRLGRTWTAPARAALLLSVGLRPPPPAETWSLLPLLTGTAAVEALRSRTGLPACLKWPNDVLVHDRKLGGILAERIDGNPPGAVVGIGINVSLRPEELPVEQATSVGIEGGNIDREPLVAELLRALERRLTAWYDAGGGARAVLPAYREICATIDSDVTVELPGGETVTGHAVDVDDTGRLVVVDARTGRSAAWAAGDVTHLRPLR